MVAGSRLLIYRVKAPPQVRALPRQREGKERITMLNTGQIGEVIGSCIRGTIAGSLVFLGTHNYWISLAVAYWSLWWDHK